MNSSVEHYVTLFDETFLPQGLALYLSLMRHSPDSQLWVICLTEVTYLQLQKLDLGNINLIRLSDIETPQLKFVKAGRSRAEYCWTLTPFSPQAVLDRCKEVSRVTYLDADMWFRGDPKRILKKCVF